MKDVDLKASTEVSRNFPSMPSFMVLSSKGSKSTLKLHAEKDGSLFDYANPELKLGNWWPLSGKAVEVSLEGSRRFYLYVGYSTWTSSEGVDCMIWERKGKRTTKSVRCNLRGSLNCSGDFQNMSRFRMGILPIDRLDKLHRNQLICMGLRVCHHLDVGRVLISSRIIEEGDVVIYSKVRTFRVETDDQVFDLIDPKHPTSCYLLVPRSGTLYYNKGVFSAEDPVASGDLWFLVNHSNRPNLDIVLKKHGIQFRAKRTIHPNEPLLWSYPTSFFGKEESAIDLQQYIIPEESVYPTK